MTSQWRRLLSELAQRGVIKAGMAYCVLAVVLLQGLDLVLSALLMPAWIFSAAAMLALLGLPVAVAFSWAFEWTPGQGLRRDPRGIPEGWIGLMARAGLVTLAVVASGSAGAVAWQTTFTRHLTSSAPADSRAGLDLRRIAVLYLDDLSPTAEISHLASGFTEALIHELAQVEQLEVLSRNAVMPFRGRTAPLDELIRSLNAGTLIHGTLETRATSLRATIQLIDGRTGANILSRVVERSGEELLVLRDEIVEEAAELLRRRLGQHIGLAQRRAQASNPAAWALVQRAEELRANWQSLEAVGDTAGARRVLGAADSLLVSAHQLDPGWTEPLVLQGWHNLILSELASFGREGFDVASLSAGLNTVQRALEIDASDPAALELRGVLRARLWRTAGAHLADTLFVKAEEDLAAAIRLDPRRPAALTEAAELARRAGRFEQALYFAESAYKADEFAISAEEVVRMLCHVNIELRDLERAASWCGEGGRRFPESARFLESELMLLASEGGSAPDVDRAWQLVEKLDRLSPLRTRQELHAGYALYVAAVLARAEMPDSARRVMVRARAQLRSDSPPPILDYYEAHALLRLGEIGPALGRLQNLVSAIPSYRVYLQADWWFEDLHSNPRFLQLVQQD
jgi:TolB-like protein